MGALADFIREEFGDVPRAPKIESGNALVAIPAIPAIPSRPNSETSENSDPLRLNFKTPSQPKEGASAGNLDDLRAEADRENARFARAGSTLRFCACGQFATFAWPDSSGREVWRCLECVDADGRA